MRLGRKGRDGGRVLDLTDAVAIKGRFWQGFELVNIGINCFCSRKTQFCGKRVKGQCPLREFEGRALKVFRLFQR